IGNTSGFSEQLSAFTRQSFDGLSLTRLHIVNAGRDFVLEGRARHPELVPEYLQRLNREEVMRGHAFAELEMRQPKLLDQRAHDRYVEFRLATLPRRRTTAEDAR
ncbi:MAG: hypothetical protein GTO41_21730, partial [Burkholderiales bacterium]|nr:hypothetical protein [Burkholderiales bacterium]